jgi:hypothetical protein
MHCQHFSGFFRPVIGTFGTQQIILQDMENAMQEAAMEALVRTYFPLLRRWKWPKVNILELARPFSDALELHRRALSSAYVTAIFLDQRNECLPGDNLEGRDPRW